MSKLLFHTYSRDGEQVSSRYIRNPRVSGTGRRLVTRHGHSDHRMSHREARRALGFYAWSPIVLTIGLLLSLPSWCSGTLGGSRRLQISDRVAEIGVQVWLWAMTSGGHDALLAGHS